MPRVENLVRAEMLNPYLCLGKQVAQIAIFADGKEIARTNRGWLTHGSSSNNDEFTAFSEMLIHNKRKVDLNFPHSFMVGDVLYVNTNDLPEFKDLGEQIANEFKHETNYGHFVEFVTGDRRNATPRTVRVMMGCYTRSVPTKAGEQVKALRDLLESFNCVDVNRYSVEKMLKNKDELIELLQSF